MRGEGQGRDRKIIYHRITPACAGRSKGDADEGRQKPDHPRVCGEKDLVDSDGNLPEGSPPRVRGEAYMCISVETRPRITPACAGRSYVAISIHRLSEDHPRVCGEKYRSP